MSLEICKKIASLEKGEILSETYQEKIVYGSWSSSFYRWLNAENRSSTLNFTCKHIEDVINDLKEENINLLYSAIEKISHFTDFYKNDKDFVKIITDRCDELYLKLKNKENSINIAKMREFINIYGVSVNSAYEKYTLYYEKALQNALDKKSKVTNENDVIQISLIIADLAKYSLIVKSLVDNWKNTVSQLENNYKEFLENPCTIEEKNQFEIQLSDDVIKVTNVFNVSYDTITYNTEEKSTMVEQFFN